MNAGKCDNYCYSERQTRRAGEGGNYCSAAREGKYLFPLLDLNIYPPMWPADSRSGDGTHGKAPRRVQVMPANSAVQHACHQCSAELTTHTYTLTSTFSLSQTHTQLPDLISGLWFPVSMMIDHFPFSHQAPVLHGLFFFAANDKRLKEVVEVRKRV